MKNNIKNPKSANQRYKIVKDFLLPQRTEHGVSGKQSVEADAAFPYDRFNFPHKEL